MLRFVLALLIVAGLVAAARAEGLRGADDPEAIADLRVAVGANDIAEAWLIAPTTRYRHFVLGSEYEAGGLRVRLADGSVLTLMLDDRHVFEDRQPRLADLNGDGRDEIVLVLTSLSEGASLAVYGVDDGAVGLRARTPFIGQPNRWLNPAGIADFDGDGRLDIAFVAMPHLVARLELWTLAANRLTRTVAIDDVSNHRLGSRHIGMAATGDFDGDGIADLAVPSGSRLHLRLISFAGGKASEVDRLFLSGRADGEIEARRAADEWIVTIPLETGDTDQLRVPVLP